MTHRLDHLASQNATYVEGLLQSFQNDPGSVPEEWREYFREITNGSVNGPVQLGPSFTARSLFDPPDPRKADDTHLDAAVLQDRVDQLIRAYRVRGHLAAKIDPLGMARPEQPELKPAYHRLTENDLDRPFSTTSLGGVKTQSLRQLITRLDHTYCRYIGAQFMHIGEPEARTWLQYRMEETANRIDLARDDQLRILRRLTDAVIFEEFVRKKYVGSKTFSLEGGESLIPLLDLAIEKASRQGVKEIVLGMAHRGRLNVLANILGKQPKEIFWEFEDKANQKTAGRGDVKYHLGFSSDWKTSEGKNVHLSLCFNPSHLEFVNTVAMGRMRAKQDRVGDFDRRQGMVVLIHGDAAFAGEGIVQETLNLSQLPGYRVGGTVHIIVNNQIGFTTSKQEARSTWYASDVARMLQIPILHVNGEHPEAVAQSIDLALDFRQKFQRDVVIDMYCFRRWGHNEGDEPKFTQPLMYEAIEQRKSVRSQYVHHLKKLGEITEKEADAIVQSSRKELEVAFDEVQDQKEFTPKPHSMGDLWDGYRGGDEPADDEPSTNAPRKVLAELLNQSTAVPQDFNLNSKLERMFEKRRQMASGEEPLDWAAGEMLAMATLLKQGHPLRLSGQDAQRGTFSHRHSVLHDMEDDSRYMPLQHVSKDQGRVEIVNSPLSEAGVLGFDYGYSLDYPEALVAWEAQFGDFVNAAQVIIDQFISSAEDKWRRLSGLVMLLPHGFEGQGPEHSSARLERFLMQAAEYNMQIASPTTPAQLFHILRRQVMRKWRKPLILFTPKSLLRHPAARSSLQEFTDGSFARTIPDSMELQNVRRLILCGGKVYYDLAKYREDQEINDVAIVRIEQYYPLPDSFIENVLKPYAKQTPVMWVQEEPENMGAWRFWRARFGDTILGREFSVVSRPESASPATGSAASHKLEQQELLQQAFAP